MTLERAAAAVRHDDKWRPSNVDIVHIRARFALLRMGDRLKSRPHPGLGSATLLTQDSRFIMVKPSIIHFAIGIVMLRRGWMIRYLPAIVTDNVPEQVLVTNGYAWAVLMFGLGLLNILVAMYCSVEVWAWFVSVGAIGAKVVAFLAQYLMFRTLIRRKLRAVPS